MAGPFTYLNNIPQATDQLSVSQGQILTNFASIDSLIDVNHVDFSSPDAGKHALVSLTNQTVQPFPLGTDVNMYNAIAGEAQQIFVNTTAGSSTTAIPMTLAQKSFQGFTYLPSGIIMIWGNITSATAGNHTFTFSSIPNFPAAYSQSLSVQLTNVGAVANNIILVSLTSTALTVNSSVTSNNVSFLVIGY